MVNLIEFLRILITDSLSFSAIEIGRSKMRRRSDRIRAGNLVGTEYRKHILVAGLALSDKANYILLLLPFIVRRPN